MRNLLLLITLLSAAFVAEAQSTAVDANVARTIIQKLQMSRPDLEYGEVKKTPLPTIYQVQVAGGPLLYSSADGNYIFVGDLYKVAPGQFVNVAEMAKIPVRRQKLAALDKKDLIIFPASGDTKAIINVFTDVDCGYCRKLHQEVPVLNSAGIEVRYLAFPRAGIGSSSYKKIVMAWCADNQQQTLTDLKNGKIVSVANCENNPVAEQYQLGLELGVTGTPALLLMDGSLIPGYKPANELIGLLGVK